MNTRLKSLGEIRNISAQWNHESGWAEHFITSGTLFNYAKQIIIDFTDAVDYRPENRNRVFAILDQLLIEGSHKRLP